MRYEADDARQRGIVAAMTSRLGAGPAAFRREGGEPRYVDTVYLGAFRASTIREIGGYDEWSGGNEDAELAWRAQRFGGVYLDPSIRSYYLGRDGLGPLARQFYRYGHNRARTIRKHPGSLSWRQLAVPALFVGIASPWRRRVLAAYAAIVLGRGAVELTRDPPPVPTLLAAFPTMHAAWGLGFCGASSRRRARGTTLSCEPEALSAPRLTSSAGHLWGPDCRSQRRPKSSESCCRH
jgi:succinoglycan biosynthesis protein ExoA